MSDPGSREALDASRCGACGAQFVPRRARCARCGVATRPSEVGAKGNVLSWTTVHVTPEGVPSPRTVALVGLEGGAAVLCLVADHRPVEIGQAVEVRQVGELYHLI